MITFTEDERAKYPSFVNFTERFMEIGGMGSPLVGFLGWLLDESDYALAKYINDQDYTDLYEVRQDVEGLLCEFWEIDVKAYKHEREASFRDALDAQRGLNDDVERAAVGQWTGEGR